MDHEDDDYDVTKEFDHNLNVDGDDDQPLRWHPLTTEEEKTSKHLRPRSSDPAWKYAVMVNRDSNKAKCLFCHYISKAGIARLKGHLIGGDRNCVKCTVVNNRVRLEVLAYENARKAKALAVRKGKQPVIEESDSEDDVVIVDDNMAPTKKAKKRVAVTKPAFPPSSGSINIGALSLKSGESLYDIVRKRTDQKQPIISEKLKKDEKIIVDRYVAKFFYSTGIPFNT